MGASELRTNVTADDVYGERKPIESTRITSFEGDSKSDLKCLNTAYNFIFVVMLFLCSALGSYKN